MLFLFGFLITVAALGLFAASGLAASTRKRPTTALRLGTIIAVVRLGLVGAGLLLSWGNDWRQIPGLGLLIVSAPFEFIVVTATGIRSLVGVALLVAGLIVATCLGLGWTWAWLRFQGAAATNVTDGRKA